MMSRHVMEGMAVEKKKDGNRKNDIILAWFNFLSTTMAVNLGINFKTCPPSHSKDKSTR